MAYLSKETLLSAYKVLSTLSDDPTLQGATQKVSAIRYFLALDMFYKKYNRECNTRNSDDKTAFIDFVNTIVTVDNCYTTNFYAPLAFHQGDSAVGSNFYSVGAVKNSLTNPAIKINYPQRGSKPLFEIQNGVLFEREDLLQNFDFYVPNNKFKCALVLWICRERYVRIEDIYSTLKTQIDILFTEKTAEILLPSEDYFVEATQDIGISAEFTKANITSEDIQKLFYKNEMKKQTSFPLQQIFYGAPGTGKSHKVNKDIQNTPNAVVSRTTFHPDSDYSTFVGAYKPTMKELPRFNPQTGDKIGVEEKIVYSFVPQAFLKAYVAAWQNPEQPVFLVIEEINRGNCAQIFGDIFQLLDRKEGVSEYPIKADQDIRDYLAKEFAGYDLEANILSGEELVLPANLHIWATMNTSDQSLFPIDSAFKRRWDWKYMPIHDAGENWTIALSDVEYDWWDFVEKINNVIGNMTSSEDKKLGYFFCKACNGKIDAEKFVNKVVFYLWNDVFKDYELSDKAFQDGEGKLTFNKFYTPSGDANEATIKTLMENMGVKKEVNKIEQPTE